MSNVKKIDKLPARHGKLMKFLTWAVPKDEFLKVVQSDGQMNDKILFFKEYDTFAKGVGTKRKHRSSNKKSADSFKHEHDSDVESPKSSKKKLAKRFDREHQKCLATLKKANDMEFMFESEDDEDYSVEVIDSSDAPPSPIVSVVPAKVPSMSVSARKVSRVPVTVRKVPTTSVLDEIMAIDAEEDAKKQHCVAEKGISSRSAFSVTEEDAIKNVDHVAQEDASENVESEREEDPVEHNAIQDAALFPNDSEKVDCVAQENYYNCFLNSDDEHLNSDDDEDIMSILKGPSFTDATENATVLPKVHTPPRPERPSLSTAAFFASATNMKSVTPHCPPCPALVSPAMMSPPSPRPERPSLSTAAFFAMMSPPSPAMMSPPSPVSAPSPAMMSPPSPVSAPSPAMMSVPSPAMMSVPSPAMMSAPSPVSAPSPAMMSVPSLAMMSVPSPAMMSAPSPVSAPSPAMMSVPSPAMMSRVEVTDDEDVVCQSWDMAGSCKGWSWD